LQTCRHCTHWHQVPADPSDLAAPRPGDCRGGPPQILVIPYTNQGRLELRAMYPVVPDDFPACGRFEARPAPARNSVALAE
jgi:hypothetical protein